MLLAATEIYIHQFLAVYYVGWDANFQLYMLGIPVFLMLGEFKRIIVPIVASILVFMSLLLLYFYTLENPTQYKLGTMEIYLAIINLLALAFVLSFYTGILTISSRMIGETLSQSKKDIAQLYEAATVDNLTQLHNRMHASSFVEHLIR